MSVTLGQTSIKHDRIDPWEILYQNCSDRSALLQKIAARAKNRRKKKSNDMSVNTGQISTKLDRIVPWEVLHQNCSNCSAPLHKMAARAENSINLK